MNAAAHNSDVARAVDVPASAGVRGSALVWPEIGQAFRSKHWARYRVAGVQGNWVQLTLIGGRKQNTDFPLEITINNLRDPELWTPCL